MRLHYTYSECLQVEELRAQRNALSVTKAALTAQVGCLKLSALQQAAASSTLHVELLSAYAVQFHPEGAAGEAGY
jgi:anthranilate/para-aminobenzoate synthase component II